MRGVGRKVRPTKNARTCPKYKSTKVGYVSRGRVDA
jgi:hypothetical protein